MDRDNDGVITRAEWLGSARGFRRFDRNGDGVLSGDEVLSANDQRETFAQRDGNRNGVITPSEWNDDPEEFRRRDTDRDGVLTREEYRQDLDGSEREPAAYRAGRERGLADGRKAGRGDRAADRWDPDGQREMETADAGYTPEVGSREDYQRGYRAGFRVGYREGFGPRK
jgi:hypothetical protein